MFHRGTSERSTHVTTMIALVLLVATSYLFVKQIKPTLAVTGSLPLCPAGFTLMVGSVSQLGTTIPVTGMTNVMFSANAVSAASVSSVTIVANDQPIGRAVAVSAYSWSMPWVTQLSTNGNYAVQAEVTMTSSIQCRTTPIQVAAQNPLPANLVLVTQPQSWQGPLSFSLPISSSLRVPETNFDATQYAIFNYVTSIGNINASGPTAQFSSGSTAGNGAIKVYASYGGKSIPINIPIIVGSATAPLPIPTTVITTNASTPPTTLQTTSTVGTTTASTGSTNITTTQQATVAARTAVLSNNTTAQDCVVAAIGRPRFDAINSGTARPTPEELKKFNACFASSNFILPSNFAPVAPKSLSDLTADSTIAINTLSNEKLTSGTSPKDALKISGKAKPNSAVVLYVFSEPLVLTTTADAGGNWTYSLQDPIEAGKHEVYAVVDRGDGVYQKSNPFNFLIGTAQAASGNPDALNLTLAGDATPAQSNRSMLIYIISAIALVLVVAIITIYVLVKVHKKRPTVQIAPTDLTLVPTIIGAESKPKEPIIVVEQNIIPTQTPPDSTIITPTQNTP